VSRARREATFWLELWRAAPGPGTGPLIFVLLATIASYGVMTSSAMLVESLVNHDGQSWTWLGLLPPSWVSTRTRFCFVPR
jgi:hypothetical protein